MKKAIKKKYHCKIVEERMNIEQPSFEHTMQNNNKKNLFEHSTHTKCSHDEIFENMCCLCGSIIVKREGYRIGDARSGSLLVKQRNTRALILDIDNTILVSRIHAPHAVLDTQNHVEHWNTGQLNMDVIWRPGIIDQLKEVAANGIALYIQTKGNRVYADEVRRRINALGQQSIVNADNVISRDEECTAGKSLAHFFNANDPHVVVLDDRIDVWGADSLYVLQVPPLLWPTEIMSDESHGLQLQFDTVRRIFEEAKEGNVKFVDIVRRLIHGREPEKVHIDKEADAALSRALDTE